MQIKNEMTNIYYWKILFKILKYDLIVNGWKNKIMNWSILGNIIIKGLENSITRPLIIQNLPQIRTSSNCITIEAKINTIIGKWVASLLFGNKKTKNNGYTYKQYRQLKKITTF